MEDLAQAIGSRLPRAAVRLKAGLAEVSTFRLGGPCRLLISCRRADEVVAAVRTLAEWAQPAVLLGSGSNLLISDEGVDVPVLRYADAEPEVIRDQESVVVPAGMALDEVVRRAAENGWRGMNACSGIPGTVGGAVVGNAGAWGQQISERLLWVEAVQRDGEVHRLMRDDIDFSYRHSSLKDCSWILLRAGFKLDACSPADLIRERREILRKRSVRHPDPELEPCIGSFFRNLAPSSKAGRRQAAGWFLEHAGAKSMRVGGAYVYPEHANIIIAGEGARADNVAELARRMAGAVDRQAGIQLQREVRYLGPLQGEQAPEDPGVFY